MIYHIELEGNKLECMALSRKITGASITGVSIHKHLGVKRIYLTLRSKTDISSLLDGWFDDDPNLIDWTRG